MTYHHDCTVKCLSLFFIVIIMLLQWLSGEAGAITTAASSCTYTTYSGSSNTPVTRDNGNRIKFTNKSSEEIWLGVIGRTGGETLLHGYKAPLVNGTSSWKIPKDQSIEWCAPKEFLSARFWPRTGCVNNYEKTYSDAGVEKTYQVFACRSGDCKKDKDNLPLTEVRHYIEGDFLTNDQCFNSGSNVSVSEFTIDLVPKDNPDDPNSKTQKIYYDVSYVDGYNFPIKITPLTDNSSCPEMGCDKLPEACFLTKDTAGQFMNGTCPAPYVHYEFNPAHKFTSEYFAVAAKCAVTVAHPDQAPLKCDCANSCDGQDKRDYKANCYNTYFAANPYASYMMQLLASSACSPVNAYYKVGREQDSGGSATFWNQTPCDPVTGYGSFYAPYFLPDHPLYPNHRAFKKFNTGSKPADRFRWDADLSSFVFDPNQLTSNGDFDKSAITVYAEKKDSLDANGTPIPGLDTFSTDVIPIFPVDIAIDPFTRKITVSGLDKSNANGKNYTITLNIANSNYVCNSWPKEYLGSDSCAEGSTDCDYVKGLHKYCPNAYAWQYDDLGGLANCGHDKGTSEAFEITFFSRPQNADNGYKLIELAPAGTDATHPKGLFMELTKAGMETVKVIGPDYANIPVKSGETLNATIYCNDDRTLQANCSATFKPATIDGKETLFDPATITSSTGADGLCKDLFTKIDLFTGHVGISFPTASQCFDPKKVGDKINIKAPGNQSTSTFSLEMNSNGLNNSTVDIPKGSAETVSIYLVKNAQVTLTVGCAEQPKTAVCKTNYLGAYQFQVIPDQGTDGYCKDRFSSTNGEINLTDPAAMFCSDPAIQGDIFQVSKAKGVVVAINLRDKSDKVKIDDVFKEDGKVYSSKIAVEDKLAFKINCSEPGKSLYCSGHYSLDKKFSWGAKTGKNNCGIISITQATQNDVLKFSAGTPVSKDDCDFNTSISEAVTAMQIILDLHPNTEDHLSLDFAPLGEDGKPMGDGKIGLSDVIVILRHALGLYNW